MNILTVSRLRAYRKCARLERLLYVDGWRPVSESEALRFGSLWHLGLEYWWTGGLDAALTAVAGRAVDEYEQARIEELLRGYDARWHGQDYEVLGVEEEFGVPLINPATWQPSRTWRLAGKVDARVRLADGRVAVVEHKTTSENIEPGSDYWLRLAMDHQLSAYLLGAETLGDSPTACIYDVVLKPALRPLRATPPDARKYTRDGRLYANQREADETPDEYRLRLREALAAEPERYFQRREIPRTESQLVEFLQDAWAQARSMRDDHLASRSPRNPEACFAYGRCPFFDVCSAGVNPAEHPESFQQLEHVHPELTEEAA
jgi:hypothetical protein